MKILIDIQSMQTSSRTRGIGHYTLSLIKEMILRDDIEVVFLLNDYCKESAEVVFKELDGYYAIDKIKIFKAPHNVSCLLGVDRLRKAASILRDYYINALNPDFVLITSLFEGATEDFVCDIKDNRNYKVGVIGYDLIPLYNPDLHLPTENMKEWYYGKLAEAKKADVIFSISESSKNEFLELGGISEKNIVNISSAGDSGYKALEVHERIDLSSRFLIHNEFILYSGACDERKNLKGLLSAYSNLDQDIKNRLDVVLVGKYSENDIKNLRKFVVSKGIKPEKIIFTGFISNKELQNLYTQCFVFIFPSFHEGFGLPVLEAMMCDAVTICSNVSSLPEVIGLEEATFSPDNISSITEKLKEAIVDESFRDRLKDNARKRAKIFSWVKTTDLLLNKAKDLCEKNINAKGSNVYSQDELIRSIFVESGYEYLDKEIRIIANCIADNEISLTL